MLNYSGPDFRWLFPDFLDRPGSIKQADRSVRRKNRHGWTSVNGSRDKRMLLLSNDYIWHMQRVQGHDKVSPLYTQKQYSISI